MKMIKVQADKVKWQFLYYFITLIMLFVNSSIAYSQCSINVDNIYRLSNEELEIKLVGNTSQTQGCNRITIRWIYPSLPEKTFTVNFNQNDPTANNTWSVPYGSSDGLTLSMLINNFSCGSSNFSVQIICATNPQCQIILPQNNFIVDCKIDADNPGPPASCSSSYQVEVFRNQNGIAIGNPIERSFCLQEGSYIAKLDNPNSVIQSRQKWVIQDNNGNSLSSCTNCSQIQFSIDSCSVRNIIFQDSTCFPPTAVLYSGCGSCSSNPPPPDDGNIQVPGDDNTNDGGDLSSYCFWFLIFILLAVIVAVGMAIFGFCTSNPVNIGIAIFFAIVSIFMLLIWLNQCGQCNCFDFSVCILLENILTILLIISSLTVVIMAIISIINPLCIGAVIFLVTYLGTIILILRIALSCFLNCSDGCFEIFSEQFQ